jgi:hypothetical protein
MQTADDFATQFNAALKTECLNCFVFLIDDFQVLERLSLFQNKEFLLVKHVII